MSQLLTSTTSSSSRDMAVEDLTDELTSLHLSDDDHLAYNPSGDKSWLVPKLNEIPRYLFRVYSPRSCGITDRSWTKSKDARHDIPSSRLDIFVRSEEEVAAMIHRHLMWKQGPDNLVSWTSSLPFALVYMFHLHANARDGSDFEDIQLCIIDTTCLPIGVLVRDLDLIRAYSSYDVDLAETEKLRTVKQGGRFYFGEYLSQGALKIEGECDIVSASALIGHGLFDLQPVFKDFAQWQKAYRPPWAYPVLHLRANISQKASRTSTADILRAVVGITQLFGSRWRLPMAINLVGSLCFGERHFLVMNLFNGKDFTGLIPFLMVENNLTSADGERNEYSPSKTRIISCDSLPEVQRVEDLMQSIYGEFCLMKMTGQTTCENLELESALTSDLLEHIARAETALRSARVWRAEIRDSASTADDKKIDLSWSSLFRRLNTLKGLCESLSPIDRVKDGKRRSSPEARESDTDALA
jgi:hypothetical protein